MEKEVLEKRINDKKVAIEKAYKKIQKLEAKKNVAGYIKERGWIFANSEAEAKSFKTLDDLVNSSQSRRNFDNEADRRKRVEDNYNSYLRSQDNEIEYTKDSIEDAQKTITKYENMLAVEKGKDEVIEIPELRKFFENWKNEIIEYAEDGLAYYHRVDKEWSEFNNKARYSSEITVKEKREKDYYYRDLINNILTGWVGIRYEKGSKQEFEKYVTRYMRDRYVELVNKVSDITGNITDVDLYIGNDGSINGIVTGTDDKAKVETIVAGGYNENIIVNTKHGQCRHYRVLVHKIK